MQATVAVSPLLYLIYIQFLVHQCICDLREIKLCSVLFCHKCFVSIRLSALVWGYVQVKTKVKQNNNNNKKKTKKKKTKKKQHKNGKKSDFKEFFLTGNKRAKW